MELKIIWQIIWRRKWIIIQAFLVIFLTAIIGSFLLTPVYETSATIFVKPTGTASSLLASIGLKSFTTTAVDKPKIFIGSHISLATMDTVLGKVISSLRLTDRNGELMKASDLKESKFILSTIFPEPYVKVSSVEDLFTSFTTSTEVSADLFQITASSSDPKEAAMIANTLAEDYIEENLKQAREEYGNARLVIEDHIKRTKTDYLNALEEIKNFKTTEITVDLETETKVAIDKMAELLKEKEDNIVNLSKARAAIETLKGQLGKQSETVVSSSAMSENPQIGELKKNIKDLDLELAGDLAEKRPDHPTIVTLKLKIKKAREELKKEMGIFQESSKSLEELEREYASLEAQLKDVNTDIDKHLSQLQTIPGKSFTQSQLNLKLSVYQARYSSFLEYLNQVGVAEAITLSDVRLVQAATEPNINKPNSPNKVLNGSIGFGLGMFLGLMFGFLVDYLDDTIKSPEDVKGHELTFLGTIPRFKRRESPIIFKRNPKDLMCESYRTVRNSIKFASIDKVINSLLVTSSIAGEGKTTTLVNLGISFTSEGKEVLLIDTDLRRPEVHSMFGLPNSIGVTNILAGEAEIEEAIKKTDIEGLSVLTSGPIPLDPGRLLESQKMQQLIKELIQKYDLIIFDSPPVLIVHDAVVLAGYVDGSILVLESRKITLPALTQALALLSQANIQPIGAILNKVRIERGGYYNYYKSGYYKGEKK